MTAVMLMVLAIFVLIMALLVNGQTRRMLYELDALAQCWPGKCEGCDVCRREGTL